MEICTIKNIVAHWAAEQPLIIRVWLFGSRVKGTERPDSDIDIAVEIHTLPGDPDAGTTFYCSEGAVLKKSLQSLLTIPVDFQLYEGAIETPRLHAALEMASDLIYEEN